MKTPKQLAALFLAGALLAGCSASPKPEALLDSAWEQDSQKISIMGGTVSKPEDGSPSGIPLDKPDEVTVAYHVPEALVEKASEAAGFMNAMMPNYLTVSAWKVKPADQDALIGEIEQTLKDTHWLDAQPDGYAILTDGDVLVVAYGIKDQLDPFVKGLEAVSSNVVEAATGNLAR